MKAVFLFSGSGLRYTYHAGVYQAFLEAFPGAEKRFIGVSGGSIVAVAAANGLTGRDILEITLESVADDYGALLDKGFVLDEDGAIDFKSILRSVDIRISDFLYLLLPDGKKKLASRLFSRLKEKALFGTMDRFKETLSKYLNRTNLEDPTIGVVATNINTGEAETLKIFPGVDPVPPCAASCSIPFVFPAEEIFGEYYSDGGVADRSGFSALTEMANSWGWNNEDFLRVVSEARPPLGSVLDIDSSIDTLNRTYLILTSGSRYLDTESGTTITIKNEIGSPGPYDVKRDSLLRSFDIGYIKGKRSFESIKDSGLV